MSIYIKFVAIDNNTSVTDKLDLKTINIARQSMVHFSVGVQSAIRNVRRVPEPAEAEQEAT